MVLKNCLKISYKGLTRNIICEANLCYDDIITKVMETFDLMDNYRNAVEIYDEHGSKFDKEVFEYFVLLFPNPQKLFFIRLDASKCWNMSASNASQDLTTRTAFSVSKSVNRIKEDNNNANASSDAVPVRRQNCFMGQWPSNNIRISQNLQSSQLPQQHSLHNHQDIVKGIVKKISLLKHSDHRTKNIATPTVVKRSMRI